MALPVAQVKWARSTRTGMQCNAEVQASVSRHYTISIGYLCRFFMTILVAKPCFCLVGIEGDSLCIPPIVFGVMNFLLQKLDELRFILSHESHCLTGQPLYKRVYLCRRLSTILHRPHDLCVVLHLLCNRTGLLLFCPSERVWKLTQAVHDSRRIQIVKLNISPLQQYFKVDQCATVWHQNLLLTRLHCASGHRFVVEGPFLSKQSWKRRAEFGENRSQSEGTSRFPLSCFFGIGCHGADASTRQMAGLIHYLAQYISLWCCAGIAH
mmetsp:Transcript_15995/g.40158  ORF Transcript_15995/g.40158 Transcript_15995/m.40158 type:complete len:267 (+) Transcript_15995:2585-3385(+)